LILLTLQFLFRFRKQKIKGGKERKRNSFRGQSTADGGGDFDVFKKQPKKNPPPLPAGRQAPEIGFAYFPLKI
jgi:hypothetical protein